MEDNCALLASRLSTDANLQLEAITQPDRERSKREAAMRTYSAIALVRLSLHSVMVRKPASLEALHAWLHETLQDSSMFDEQMLLLRSIQGKNRDVRVPPIYRARAEARDVVNFYLRDDGEGECACEEPGKDKDSKDEGGDDEEVPDDVAQLTNFISTCVTLIMAPLLAATKDKERLHTLLRQPATLDRGIAIWKEHACGVAFAIKPPSVLALLKLAHQYVDQMSDEGEGEEGGGGEETQGEVA